MLVTRVGVTKLIGCRAAVRALLQGCIEFANCSSVQFSSSAVNTAFLCFLCIQLSVRWRPPSVRCRASCTCEPTCRRRRRRRRTTTNTARTGSSAPRRLLLLAATRPLMHRDTVTAASTPAHCPLSAALRVIYTHRFLLVFKHQRQRASSSQDPLLPAGLPLHLTPLLLRLRFGFADHCARL